MSHLITLNVHFSLSLDPHAASRMRKPKLSTFYVKFSVKTSIKYTGIYNTHALVHSGCFLLVLLLEIQQL